MNPARQPAHDSPSGFTLVELLLVVVISLTLAGLAGVGFSRSYQAGRLRTAARDFIALGRYARARAILDGRPAVLRIDVAAGTADIWLRAVDEDESIELTDDAEALEWPDDGPFQPAGMRRTLPDRLRITRIRIGDDTPHPGEAAQIRFYPTGASDYALIRIEDDAERWLQLELDGAGAWGVTP